MNIHQITLKVLTGFIALSTGLSAGCDTASRENPWKYPDNPPPGVYDPDAPQAKAMYKLPHPWEIQPDRSDVARLAEPGKETTSLLLGWLRSSKPNAKETRDERWQEVKCSPTDEEGPFVNCKRGFVRDVLKMKGYQVYRLSYFGSPYDIDAEIHEMYIDYQGGVLSVSGEGIWQDLEPALASILESFYFIYVDPSSIQSVDVRERHGL